MLNCRGQGGVADTVLESLPEQLDRLGKALLVIADLTEHPECVGTNMACRYILQDRLEQRPGAGQFACVVAVLGSPDHALLYIGSPLLRRQLKGTLGQV